MGWKVVGWISNMLELFSGMKWESLGDACCAVPWFSFGPFSLLYYMSDRSCMVTNMTSIKNTKEIVTDLTLGNCNMENVADLFCVYVSNSQVENTLLCIGFQCLFRLWYV